MKELGWYAPQCDKLARNIRKGRMCPHVNLNIGTVNLKEDMVVIRVQR